MATHARDRPREERGRLRSSDLIQGREQPGLNFGICQKISTADSTFPTYGQQSTHQNVPTGTDFSL